MDYLIDKCGVTSEEVDVIRKRMLEEQNCLFIFECQRNRIVYLLSYRKVLFIYLLGISIGNVIYFYLFISLIPQKGNIFNTKKEIASSAPKVNTQKGNLNLNDHQILHYGSILYILINLLHLFVYFLTHLFVFLISYICITWN